MKVQTMLKKYSYGRIFLTYHHNSLNILKQPIAGTVTIYFEIQFFTDLHVLVIPEQIFLLIQNVYSSLRGISFVFGLTQKLMHHNTEHFMFSCYKEMLIRLWGTSLYFAADLSISLS